MAGLRPLHGALPGLIRDVRGKGLMIGIEFDTPEHAEEVQWACFERGLLVLECGQSSVRMSPPLTVTEAEMATALRIFGEAVAQVAGHAPEIARPRRRGRCPPRGRGGGLSREPGDTAARRGSSCDDEPRLRSRRCATRSPELVRDGDTVAIEGFTHLICFAAGHEIIRQGRRDLTLARLTPDLIYDQMIAAGVARKLVF